MNSRISQPQTRTHLPHRRRRGGCADIFNNVVTSITHKKPDETSIVQHSYTYDSTNNNVEYLNSLDGQTSYDYDFLGQLIGADYASTGITDESYTYNENGNRLTANGDDYTTGTNNELTSDSNWTYTYDDEGNRVSKSNSTHRELYEWDYRNRLTSVTQETYDTATSTWTTVQIVEYTYDYNNVWIRKILDTNGDGTVNSKSIFIPENYQTTVQIDNDTISHHYLWTPQHQDKLLADTTTDGVLWSLTDHLGTIRDIIGTATTHLIYDAFGNLISGTNPILFGYTGKAFDVDTQLQNNINRWYDATVGRWLSTDPIGFEGSDTNLYRFAGNNIINKIDSIGLKDYKIGTDYPYIQDDAGSGVYQSLKLSFSESAFMLSQRQILRTFLVIPTFFIYPDAAEALLHYFNNSGIPYDCNFFKLLKEDKPAQVTFKSELKEAISFAKSQKNSKFSITSSRVSTSTPNGKNWYLTLGTYSIWGKADVTYDDQKCQYSMYMTVYLDDRYNWDGKKTTLLSDIVGNVSIGSIKASDYVITDEFLGRFHLAGLAKEYQMTGYYQFALSWNANDSPEKIASDFINQRLNAVSSTPNSEGSRK